MTLEYLPADVRCEEHVMNQMLGSRYPGVDADHAIVVHPGNASRPGILESFCAHHADRGVDVWKLDGHFSPEGRAEGVAAWGAHVAKTTSLPVFLVGSTRRAADIYRALQANALLRMIQADALPHQIYNLSSGYTTSAREQLLTLYRIRPDAAQLVNLDPETLRAEPYPSNGYNADLLTRDTGWRRQYTFEEALEDNLKWLSEHPYRAEAFPCDSPK